MKYIIKKTFSSLNIKQWIFILIITLVPYYICYYYQIIPLISHNYPELFFSYTLPLLAFLLYLYFTSIPPDKLAKLAFFLILRSFLIFYMVVPVDIGGFGLSLLSLFFIDYATSFLAFFLTFTEKINSFSLKNLFIFTLKKLPLLMAFRYFIYLSRIFNFMRFHFSFEGNLYYKAIKITLLLVLYEIFKYQLYINSSIQTQKVIHIKSFSINLKSFLKSTGIITCLFIFIMFFSYTSLGYYALFSSFTLGLPIIIFLTLLYIILKKILKELNISVFFLSLVFSVLIYLSGYRVYRFIATFPLKTIVFENDIYETYKKHFKAKYRMTYKIKEKGSYYTFALGGSIPSRWDINHIHEGYFAEDPKTIFKVFGTRDKNSKLTIGDNYGYLKFQKTIENYYAEKFKEVTSLNYLVHVDKIHNFKDRYYKHNYPTVLSIKDNYVFDNLSLEVFFFDDYLQNYSQHEVIEEALKVAKLFYKDALVFNKKSEILIKITCNSKKEVLNKYLDDPYVLYGDSDLFDYDFFRFDFNKLDDSFLDIQTFQELRAYMQGRSNNPMYKLDLKEKTTP